jgi:hypothetical protein
MRRAVQPASETWTEPPPELSQDERLWAVDTPQVGNERELLPLLFGEDAEKTEGAGLFDLSQEEWQRVCQAPLLSFLWVASADGRVLPGERRELVHVLEEGKRARSRVFRAVCGELLRRRDTLLTELVSESMLRAEQLPEVYRLLVQKQGPSEAERFKWCLLEVGRRVAQSSGGLLASWGWLRRVERQALAELALVLERGRA